MDYNEPHTASTRGPSTAGLTWQNGMPTLRMEDAVVETVVTHTTRTTTSFAPIILPRVPPPESIGLPTHLKQEQYPLANQPAPPDMQFFTLNLGGRRVVVQDESVISPSADGTLRSSGPGWTKTFPTSSYHSPGVARESHGPEERVGFLQALNRSKGKEVRKRPHNFSRPGSRQEEGMKVDTNTPPISAAEQLAIRQRSPPRKKIRALEEISIHPQKGNASLLSPLPSPEHEAGPSTPTSATSPTQPNLGTGAEVSALLSLPVLVSQFDQLPDRLQQHFLMHLLRRSRMPTIQRISTFASTALKRDFIALLPHEVAVQILRRVDRPGLAIASRVCKKWKRMIDTERVVWQQRLIDDDLWQGHGVEEAEERKILDRYEILDWKAEREIQNFGREDTPSDDERMLSATNPSRLIYEQERPTPLKHVYRRRYQNKKSWLHNRPEHTSFSGHGTNVVTCLQFDEDKIISASDEHSINIHDTVGGRLRKSLDGHQGGVWTLEYKGDTLVSGSTDRTVRIWDLENLEQVHVFSGHTSTVRCLQIVEPVWNEREKQWQPPYPMIVTGSRDATLRVWRLPEKGDRPYNGTATSDDEGDAPSPEDNPYHLRLLEGHSGAVRALAAHGRICVSGSYDMTVRVWDIVKGTCIHVLTGHEAKVYSIVYDQYRNRCASGSMDNTVKIWDLATGDCLHTLTGHTSLVGLLGISPNYLVSAAADASLRIWDPETLQMKNVLASHGGAITCFQHDETKVVSGSDGALKLWDIKTGLYIRDLVVGISSVWQVAFNGNLLVAASNRGGQTVFDVFNFAPSPAYSHFPEGIDDDQLDLLRTPKWKKDMKRLRLKNKTKDERSRRITGQSPPHSSRFIDVNELLSSDSDDDLEEEDVGLLEETPISASYKKNKSTTSLDRWEIGGSNQARYGGSPSASGSGGGNRRSTRIAGRSSLGSSGIEAGPSRRHPTHQVQPPPPAFTHTSFTASPTYNHHHQPHHVGRTLQMSRRAKNRRSTGGGDSPSPSIRNPAGYEIGTRSVSGRMTTSANPHSGSSFAPIFDEEPSASGSTSIQRRSGAEDSEEEEEEEEYVDRRGRDSGEMNVDEEDDDDDEQ
ncbi:uncharacterized protein L199_001457 [Kwoniella botswanensis]|uniref:uncharacterized protein n=1 Tax=Kwoniella botswanensis TaxID=1268659 RepID=UPI00315DE3BE